jgi:adenylate cyclase
VERKKLYTRVKYPIGFKLVTIITILLLISLGAISFLVSMMVSQDIQITAEENNFTLNQRSASEAEIALSTLKAGVLVLLDTISAAGSQPALIRQASAFYYERNQDIAAIVISDNREIINNRFFLTNELESSLLQTFIESEQEAVERCKAGEAILLNAAPLFHIPLLAMFYPWQEDGGAEAVIIFFSSESLSDNFGRGANASFLVNDAGDILVHPDYEMVRSGVNAEQQPFVAMMRESRDLNSQTLYTDRDGKKYFGAFQKISTANAAVITIIEYDVVFEGIAATTRRNIFLTAAVLFASIILILFFSKTISRPLQSLTLAAEKIEAGEFELDLEPGTKDEIGALTASFGKMSSALGIFGRFTNREIAVRAMRGEIKPGGESKYATVFFPISAILRQ